MQCERSSHLPLPIALGNKCHCAALRPLLALIIIIIIIGISICYWGGGVQPMLGSRGALFPASEPLFPYMC